MSRTRKGSKGPGWEPWSNRDQRQEQRADYEEPEPHWSEGEICDGCRVCMCVQCGGHVFPEGDLFRCIGCQNLQEGFPDE